MLTPIASDLADDIVSTFTSISYYSELVKMQLKKRYASLKLLPDKTSNSAKEGLNSKYTDRITNNAKYKRNWLSSADSSTEGLVLKCVMNN